MRRSAPAPFALALVLASLSFPPPAACGPAHVGIVSSPPGGAYRHLGASGETPLAAGTKLHPGDAVLKPAGAKPPEVIWWPYAGWKDPAASERLEVELRPPADPAGGGILESVQAYMGFVETDYAAVHGVSDEPREIRRDEKFDLESEKLSPEGASGDASAKRLAASEPAEAPTLDSAGEAAQAPPRIKAAPAPTRAGEIPRPGVDDTLIPGVDVEFRVSAGSKEERTLVIRRADGREAFRRAFTGSLRLKPEAIGLSRGETWTWEIEGAGPPVSGRMRLLPRALDARLRVDLDRLRREIPDAAERKVRIAAYLQLLSDACPGEASLYWLSLRMLDDLVVPTGASRLAAAREALRTRAIERLRRPPGGR